MSDGLTTLDVGALALGILLITLLATSPLLIGGWLIGRLLRALKPLPEIQDRDAWKGKGNKRTNPATPDTEEGQYSASHSAAYSTILVRELGRENEIESWDRERRRRYGRHQHKHTHRDLSQQGHHQDGSASPLSMFA